MSRSKINVLLLIVAALIISLGVMGCNQYVGGAKVRLQENPPNYEAAIATLNEGLNYAPKNADMYALLAYCYVQTNEYKKARESYEKAIEYSQTQKDSLKTAWNNDWVSVYNAANSYLKKSVAAPKDSAKTLLEKAERNLNQAIDLNPSKVESYISLGFLYRYTGKTKESQEMYAKALSVDPNNPDVYFQVGRSAMESQNWDEAIKNLAKATELKKDNDQWFYWLGVAYLQKRDFLEAQKSLTKATQLKPDDKNAWFNLAQAYYFEGSDVKKAIEPLEKVIALDNTDVEALSLMGTVAMHSTVNDYDKAIEAYSRALAFKPESQEYKEYLEYAKKQKDLSMKPVVTPKKKKR